MPFGEALFGAGHSGSYATIYNTIHGIQAGGSSNNSFALEAGGGLDIAITPYVSIRAAEVDYLLTRFSAQQISANQNNFRYMAGSTSGLAVRTNNKFTSTRTSSHP